MLLKVTFNVVKRMLIVCWFGWGWEKEFQKKKGADPFRLLLSDIIPLRQRGELVLFCVLTVGFWF